MRGVTVCRLPRVMINPAFFGSAISWWTLQIWLIWPHEMHDFGSKDKEGGAWIPSIPCNYFRAAFTDGLVRAAKLRSGLFVAPQFTRNTQFTLRALPR